MMISVNSIQNPSVSMIINTDHIVTMKGMTVVNTKKDFVRIELVGGDQIDVRGHIHEFENLCGLIIQAPPGYFVLEPVWNNSNLVHKVSVVAFRHDPLLGADYQNLKPITVCNGERPDATILHPGGRCTYDGDIFSPSMQAYLESIGSKEEESPQ